MKIKVCGVKDAESILQASKSGADYIGLHFYEESPANVLMLPTYAGIIPDRGSLTLADIKNQPKRVGVFKDEMPQNIITRVVNFNLDIIQLTGHESPIIIRNLRSTIKPDIKTNIEVWKALDPTTESYSEYEDYVDAFIINRRNEKFIQEYTGKKPFLLSGTFSENDINFIRSIRHPQFIGIDISYALDEEKDNYSMSKAMLFMEKTYALLKEN